VGMMHITGNRIVATASLAAALLLASGARPRAEETKISYVVGKWAYTRLSEAHDFIGKGKYSAALKLMDSMQNKKRLNPHERALMWQTYGYIYSSQELFPKAIQSFKECLALKALPKGAALDTQYNLGQLYMANRQFKQAVSTLTDWIGQVDKPSPDAKYLLSMALTQVKDWKRALDFARQAVAGVKRPRETWLQLLLSIHFELKQSRQVARVLERLIKLFPKKIYWMQLSAIYFDMKDEKRALAVLEICHSLGYLKTHGQQMNLFSLLMHVGAPFKAARVLDKGLKDGIIKRNEQTLTMLGDAWLRAREYDRAVLPLITAAKLSAKGNLWTRVAQIHMEQEAWPKAGKALQNAIAKGTLTNPGNARLLLGITYFRTGSYKKARDAFEKAREFKDSKKAAATWLKALAERSKAK